MNVESIKSELQQVLDSDIALRKEYNEVKRSLSDYRNQLIQRDEDCKRLQVSIDVLNTKLVVMERDNLNYKNEVASFKELRNTIREQLQEKQDEIDGLLSKIDELNNQLASISSEYEGKLSDLQLSSQEEISSLKNSYESQIAELKTNTSYQQNGIRSELEQKINELTNNYNSELSTTKSSYESQIEQLKSEFSAQLESLKQESESRVAQLSGSSTETVNNLTNEYETKISSLTNQWNSEKAELTSSFESQISSLTESFSVQKTELISSYETQISDLNATLIAKQTEFETELNSKIESLNNEFIQKEISIRAEYESQLSSTVLNSNEENVRLVENMNKVVVENEHFKEKIREMVYHIDAQNTQIEALTKDIEIKAEEISKQIDRYNSLNTEFDSFKASQLSSIDEKVNGLNETIAQLETSLSLKDSVIAELNSTIEEQSNQYSVLNTSNEELKEQFRVLSVSFNQEQENFANFKNDFESGIANQLQQKDVEFNKLLAENTSLISEIDATADKLEATESELELVKAELSELKSVSEGRAEDLREALQNKNFEITNLTANNMALQTELDLLKAELDSVRSELKSAIESNETSSSIQGEFNTLMAAKSQLETELASYKSTITSLNAQVSELNNSILAYQSEIESLKSATKVDEQDAFIDRLFKQIDMLSDERLTLLNEKEEMAAQLLKMNDTITTISQQVDSHDIDVTELDNHRKNVILAGSSSKGSSTEKSAMKKQINELVREIDKCIALLSA